jgi:broad specificity phosphatase PhoE
MRVLLIRPGSTEYDRQGRIQGNLDIPLCDEGRTQVGQLLASIDTQGLVAIYCGSGQAAKQTAAMLAEQVDLKVKQLDSLANLDHGLWQGMLIDDVRTKQPKVYRKWHDEPQTVCPPQGETVTAARKRVQDTLAKIARKHKTGTVAVVVANPLSCIVRHVLTGTALCDMWNPGNQVASAEIIETMATTTSGPASAGG